MGSASKITGSLGRRLAVLSFDAAYLRERDAFIQKPTSGPFGTAGLVFGNLADGVIEGALGLIAQPAVGLITPEVDRRPAEIHAITSDGTPRRSDRSHRPSLFGVQHRKKSLLQKSRHRIARKLHRLSARGLAKGVGKGLIGVFVKPTGALLDGVSKTFDATKNFFLRDHEGEVKRARPRRVVKHGDISVTPYELADSLVFDSLSRIEQGKFAHEKLYFYCDTGHGYLISTNRHIVFIEKNSEHLFFMKPRKCEASWCVQTLCLAAIELEIGDDDDNTVTLYFRTSDVNEAICRKKFLHRFKVDSAQNAVRLQQRLLSLVAPRQDAVRTLPSRSAELPGQRTASKESMSIPLRQRGISSSSVTSTATTADEVDIELGRRERQTVSSDGRSRGRERERRRSTWTRAKQWMKRRASMIAQRARTRAANRQRASDFDAESISLIDPSKRTYGDYGGPATEKKLLPWQMVEI